MKLIKFTIKRLPEEGAVEIMFVTPDSEAHLAMRAYCKQNGYAYSEEIETFARQRITCKKENGIIASFIPRGWSFRWKGEA